MKNSPIIFGVPFWKGNVSYRVAKKYIKRWPIGYHFKHRDRYQLNVGDLVNDCSAFNGKILEIDPVYVQVGRGEVLIDIDLTTTNTGCSLTHCGITSEMPQKWVEARQLSFMKNYIFTEKNLEYIKNELKYESYYLTMQKRLDCLESGGHITDDQGMLLPEYK